jgi:hypothetical protein
LIVAVIVVVLVAASDFGAHDVESRTRFEPLDLFGAESLHTFKVDD